MVDKKNNSIPGQKTNRNLFSCKKAASVSIFMMIAEILIVLIVSYSSIQIAQVYASSETVEKLP